MFVTNDSAHPVPTMATGTTPISGAVTVANPNPIPVSGSVTITNQNPVVIADPELAREPARILLGFDGDYQHIYDIPAGKRLVVEFISAWDSDVARPLWDLTVVDAGSGHGRVRYQFVGEPVPYCSPSCYVLNQAIHFYADEGDRLIRGAGGVGTEDLPLNITGYFIDRP
ncbi:MAG: hypothetical protein GEV06_07225 [Luteitalea sp.]|nr:hypothetical protein [Luteitalea sp.]